LILIDTNVYSALLLGNKHAIEAISDAGGIVIALASVAELRYGFINGTQAAANEDILQKFLARSGILVAAPSIKTTVHYAELQLLCKKSGRALSQNDIWIAATAKENGYKLLTFDKDFEVFEGLFGKDLKILA